MTRSWTAAVLMVVAAHGLGAQERPETDARSAESAVRHDGFWFAFGLGGGLEALRLDFNPTRRIWEAHFDGLRGGSASIRLGGTVNPQVLFGAEVQAFWREESNTEHVSIMAMTQLYPSAEGGLFGKLGFGVAERDGPGPSDDGIGTSIGVGYDFRIGRNWYVTPVLDLFTQHFEERSRGGALFMLGFTWH